MPSRYHPIEDGLWDDPKFDAREGMDEAPGDERGFFAFLASNKMQRPSGIYRATDSELAATYRWPEKRVTDCILILSRRQLLVRDGAWIFLPGYLKRQAANPGVLKAARKGVESCTSSLICASFAQHYPLYKEWLLNRSETVSKPTEQIRPSEQSRAEQSKSEQSRAREPFGNGSETVGSGQPDETVVSPDSDLKDTIERVGNKLGMK